MQPTLAIAKPASRRSEGGEMSMALEQSLSATAKHPSVLERVITRNTS